jgi:hypothetical protein
MTSVGDAGQSSFPIQRKWQRHQLQVEVSVNTQVPARVVRCLGQGSELNGGGLTLEADIDLKVADQIVIRFTPPGCNESMSFRCFVRNLNEHRYGLEFIVENDADYLNTGRLQEGLARQG